MTTNAFFSYGYTKQRSLQSPSYSISRVVRCVPINGDGIVGEATAGPAAQVLDAEASHVTWNPCNLPGLAGTRADFLSQRTLENYLSLSCERSSLPDKRISLGYT